MKVCTLDGCQKAVYARGWCQPHYMRWFRHGDPKAGRTALGEPAKYLEGVVLIHTDDGACLIWPYGRNSRGYGTFHQAGKTQLVTRVVCEAVNGAAPSPEHEAAHSCGKGHDGCCNPHHLRWATGQENADDRSFHGTSTLTSDQVEQIMKLKGVETQMAIARRFGIHNSMVSFIHSGKRRASVINAT